MTTTKLPEITTYFCIGGPDFDPEECTRRLGIEPTKVRRQKHPHLISRSDLNKVEWCVGREKQPAENIDDEIGRVLALIWAVRDKPRELLDQLQVRCSLTCSVHIHADRPVYELRAHTMQMIAELGANFLLDIFDMSDR